jgi:hypothetical protein
MVRRTKVTGLALPIRWAKESCWVASTTRGSTIEERRRQRIEKNVAAASGRYVSIGTIALLLDRSRTQAGDRARSKDFP